MSIICQNQRLWNGYSLLRPCNIISHSSESLSTPQPLNPPLKQPPHTAFLLFDPKPSSTHLLSSLTHLTRKKKAATERNAERARPNRHHATRCIHFHILSSPVSSPEAIHQPQLGLSPHPVELLSAWRHDYKATG